MIWIPAFIAAAFHLLAFAMESMFWTTPRVLRVFRQTPEQAQITKVLAFNQGFYNLLLALEIVAGFALVRLGHDGVGLALASWACLSMTLAAAVLLVSKPGMIRGAVLQGVPPIVFLVLVVANL